MKVLHVVPSFHPANSYGGPIRSTFEVCRNVVELGCEVRVLTTDANGLESGTGRGQERGSGISRGVSGSLLSAPPAAFSLANPDEVITHVHAVG